MANGVFTEDDLAPAAAPAAGRSFSDADVAIDHGADEKSGETVASLMASQAGRFMTSAWENLNPASLVHAVRHSFDTDPNTNTGRQMFHATVDALDRFDRARAKGDWGEAAKSLTGAIPVFGPQAEQIVREIDGGNYAEALGHAAGLRLALEAPKLLGKAPGAVRSGVDAVRTAANTVRTAGATVADAVRNPANTVGDLARQVPASVTEDLLPKIEKAATLKPGTADAIKILPGGSSIVATANTAARLARTARARIKTAQGLGENAPAVPGSQPAGVAYPGAQDPAAVQPRTPQVDETVAQTPTPAPRVFTEDDLAPPARPGASTPGAQDPNAVQPRTPVIDEAVAQTPTPAARTFERTPAAAQTQTLTPAELLNEIAQGMAHKPFESLSAEEQAGALRAAANVGAKLNPPPAEAPAAAETPQEPGTNTAETAITAETPVSAAAQEAQPADTTSDTAAAVPEPAAAPEPAAQPDLLDEPAYNRPAEKLDTPEARKAHYQENARKVKGRAIARLLANPPAGPSITLEEAQRIPFGDHRWNIIAELAGVNPPTSPEALQAVFDHMAEIGAGRAQLDLAGTSTDAAGAAAAPDATLPANAEPAQGDRAARPGETANPGEGSQGVPLQAAPASGDRPGAGKTAPDVVRIPGEGRSFPVTYRVRELADVQPSHSGITFQPNEKYSLVNDRNYTKPENQGKILEGSGGKFEPDLHLTDNPDPANGPPVVDARGNAIGGNGRTMQLQRVYAYNQPGAAAYRDMLMRKAPQFGIDPAEVAGMKQPILVREIADEHLGNPQHAITDLNKTGTASLTPAERAIADSRRVSHNTLDDINRRLVAGGDEATLTSILGEGDGPEILNRLIDDGVITSQEKAGLVSGDKLTAAGKSRVIKLMLGRFFRDPAQLDTVPAKVTGKLERIAAPIAKLEDAGPWNLMPRLQEALDLLDEMHSYGRSNMDEFLKQTGLLGESRYTQDAIGLAKTLTRVSGRRIAEAVKEYQTAAGAAAEHADAKSGLFGDQLTPTPEAYQVGDIVRLKPNAQGVLDSQKGQTGRVALTFNETSPYSGKSVPSLEVMVGGRHARVAAWEVDPITPEPKGPQQAFEDAFRPGGKPLGPPPRAAKPAEKPEVKAEATGIAKKIGEQLSKLANDTEGALKIKKASLAIDDLFAALETEPTPTASEAAAARDRAANPEKYRLLDLEKKGRADQAAEKQRRTAEAAAAARRPDPDFDRARAEALKLQGQADREYQSRIDADRATLELKQKSRRQVDAGRQSIEDSPLFGGERQGGLF
jgi:hypothetical protein